MQPRYSKARDVSSTNVVASSSAWKTYGPGADRLHPEAVDRVDLAVDDDLALGLLAPQRDDLAAVLPCRLQALGAGHHRRAFAAAWATVSLSAKPLIRAKRTSGLR